MKRFNPSRLTVARQRRGLSKTKLALKVGKTPKMISNYESGGHDPPDSVVNDLATALDFPPDFFFLAKDPLQITQDGPSFRSLAKMTAGQRDSVLAIGSLAMDFNALLEEHFALPKVDIPDNRDAGDPEVAAETLRVEWGLGERPINNMIHLLESRGVRVYSLEGNQTWRQTVDAVSMWVSDTPFVFLNTAKSAERSRFDAAHELGHLTLHRHGRTQGQEAEREANAFASAFLMPRASVIASRLNLPTPEKLVKKKKRWKVSVAAYTKRLADLNLLTDWQYRHLYIEISRRGWRTNEPEEGERETSKLLQKTLSALNSEGKHGDWIAQRLQLSTNEVNRFVFGLLMFGVEGGAQARQRSPRTKGDHLRLVK